LLLDEPTNHLDLTTREALSMALNEFEGTVLLVSHDRALLRETCDEFWLVTRGGVQPFDGDLDDYQAWLLEVAKAVQRGLPPPEPGGWTVTPAPPAGSASAASSAVPSASAAPPPAAKDKPKGGARAPESSRDERQAGKSARAAAASQTRPLRQEIARIDERLARLGTEKAEVERDLAQPDRGAEAYADLGRRLAHIGAEMAMLEERWLEVSTQLESIAATP